MIDTKTDEILFSTDDHEYAISDRIREHDYPYNYASSYRPDDDGIFVVFIERPGAEGKAWRVNGLNSGKAEVIPLKRVYR
jgi:hypothetical protein